MVRERLPSSSNRVQHNFILTGSCIDSGQIFPVYGPAAYALILHNFGNAHLLYSFTGGIRISFILLDFAFCATAGAAAAAAGAHSNGSEVTADIVRLGALAGVISSGILNFCAFVSSFTVHTMQFALMFGVSSFGIAFLVVLAIGQRVLHEGKS